MLTATILFNDDFAHARLTCEGADEKVLLWQCKKLIAVCGIKPQLMDSQHKPFIVMAVYGANGCDGDLTRQIQFDLLDWMTKCAKNT